MAHVHPFPLAFDAEGKQTDPAQLSAILEALLHADPPITDLWVLAYGWNNDIHSARSQQTYDQWTSHLQQEVQRLQNQGRTYQPLFVEIFWPSQAWADDIAHPPDLLDGDSAAFTREPLGRKRFIDHYSSMLDPKGQFGSESTDDFSRLYDLISQPQSSPEEAREFVQRLDKYKAVDPHNDLTEANNIVDAPVDGVVQRLQKQPLIPPGQKAGMAGEHLLPEEQIPGADQQLLPEEQVLSADQQLLPEERTPSADQHLLPQEHIPDANEHVLPLQPNTADPLLNNLLDFFRVFTFWTIKARSAVVGEKGVYPFLKEVKEALRQEQRSVRLHLLGHSFGAKLLTSAVYSAAGAEAAPFVDTLVLLLGAFSQFSFSSTTPAFQQVSPRGYAAVVERGLVANPLLVIYSPYDLANGWFYPLGMLPVFESLVFAYEPLVEAIDALVEPVTSNRLGAIGANGAQGMGQRIRSLPQLLSLDQDYDWSNLNGIACVNVNGGNVISQGDFPVGAHNDFNHAEIFHAALAMSRAIAGSSAS